MNLNKITLLGNVGNTPDVGTHDGEVFATFRLATSRGERDATSGVLLKKTEWHSVITFGKLAEVVKEYIRSGDRVYVEGRLAYRAVPGQEQVRTMIVCTNLIMLGSTRKQATADGEG